MVETLAATGVGRRSCGIWAGVFALAGLSLDYIAARHSFLRPGTVGFPNYFGGWGDIILPIVAFALTLLAVVFFGLSLVQTGIRANFMLASVISLPLVVLYGGYYLTFQFFQTGSDRYGQCGVLMEAAALSHDIPGSHALPGTPAVGCAGERRGMLLWPSTSLVIYGVTDSVAQQRVIENIRDYQERDSLFPVWVMFYEKENWTARRKSATGANGGKRGPEKLLRVVVVR
jgi:hypothetical protein